MNYFTRGAIALVGGTGSIVAFHEAEDPTLPTIMVIAVIVAFIATYVWRILYQEMGRMLAEISICLALPFTYSDFATKMRRG